MVHPPLFDDLKARAPLLSVGLLTANWMTLGSELELLVSAGIKLLHFDVMDGLFAPMMTFGASVVAGLKTPLLKDVHLMVSNPIDKLDSFVAAGADIITVHAESTSHIHRVLQSLGTKTNVNDAGRGILRGLALNPGTSLEAVRPLIEELDLVMLLAVNPGWGGQDFIASAAQRVKELRRMVGKDLLIGLDGGIKKSNISKAAELGPDIIVTGSAVFDGRSARENVTHLLSAIQ